MSTYEQIGFWGSVASIVGLVVAFYEIYRSKQRIKAIELGMSASASANGEANAHATALSDGGKHEQTQNVMQAVGVGKHPGLHQLTCSRIKEGSEVVQVSVNSNGVALHAVCDHLKNDYSCKLGDAERPDCMVIHPDVIFSHRRFLAGTAGSARVGCFLPPH